MDSFTQLVKDLDEGKLTLRMICIAYKTHIRNRKDLPDGIKDFLVGDEGKTSIIHRQFDLIGQYVGFAELIYRRASDSQKHLEQDTA